MTTTGTCRSPAAPAILSLVLLATVLLTVAVAPTYADEQGSPTATAAARPMVPEPATLIFVGVAGLVLFHRSGKQRVR
jgi:hypothetical protein